MVCADTALRELARFIHVLPSFSEETRWQLQGSIFYPLRDILKHLVKAFMFWSSVP